MWRGSLLLFDYLLCASGSGIMVVISMPARAAPKSNELSVRNNVRRFYAWYIGQIDV